MVRWIPDFTSRYHQRTSRCPVIYTFRMLVDAVHRNSSAFSRTSPLMLASWIASPGSTPGHWATHTIWQDTDDGYVAGIVRWGPMRTVLS